MNQNSGGGLSQIHLQDLLQLKKQVRVLLADRCRKQLFEEARNTEGSWEALSRHLSQILNRNISGWSLAQWKKGNRYLKYRKTRIDTPAPLDVITSLSERLSKRNSKYSLRKIEREIIFLKGQGDTYRVWHPSLPISLENPYTGAVIGHVLHDGHFEKQRLRVVYSNSELENLLHYKKSIQGMLGTKNVGFGEIRGKDGTVRVSCPNIVGYLLSLFGLRPGNKLKVDPSPPELSDYSKTVIRSYLQALSDDDASPNPASCGSGGCIKIELASRDPAKPSRLIKADRRFFRKIGINPGPIHLSKIRHTKRGEVSARWLFIISGRNNLELFQRKVGFITECKREKLRKILEHYRYSSHYVLLQEDFRVKLFQKAIEIMGGIDSYCSWLESELGRKVSLSSVRDWMCGRYSTPLKVIAATSNWLNEKAEADYSAMDVYSNIILYRPDRNSKKVISLEKLTILLNNLGLEIL